MARCRNRRANHGTLRRRVCAAEGRSSEPSTRLTDSRSARTADTVPAVIRGLDAGEKFKGRKRFLVTDTLSLLLAVHVVAAGVQDCDGAKHPLRSAAALHSLRFPGRSYAPGTGLHCNRVRR
ncbi:transposase [Streptomyces sp. enrichment culture]|uniref:transposase n=1 Tax=Streptomyces sp. enrichment culture TaxID=1795815 RepID=UPI003F54BB0C